MAWHPPQRKGRPPEKLTGTFDDLTNETATGPWFPDRNFSIRARRLQTSHQLRKEKAGDLGHVEPGRDLAPEPWAPKLRAGATPATVAPSRDFFCGGGAAVWVC